MREDSTVYVGVPLSVTPPGVDLTLDTFEMAFVATATSTVDPADWNPATWDPVLGVVKMLVGPGGVVIPPGKWVVLLRVTDNPEIPVIAASGSFTISALVP